jgi:hypothetical protein
MARRRPSGRTLLAAAAALAALAGGAVAWIVASGDDDPAQRTTSVASGPSATGPETGPSESSEPSAESTIETEEVEPGGGSEQEAGSEPTATTPQGTHKTRFPRERGEARAKSTPKRFAIPPAREFSGRGNARLGTVELRTASVVKWSTQGRFELRFGREAFPIIAPSPSGQLVVPPYSFDLVRVIADGRWKISITPQR